MVLNRLADRMAGHRLHPALRLLACRSDDCRTVEPPSSAQFESCWLWSLPHGRLWTRLELRLAVCRTLGVGVGRGDLRSCLQLFIAGPVSASRRSPRPFSLFHAPPIRSAVSFGFLGAACRLQGTDGDGILYRLLPGLLLAGVRRRLFDARGVLPKSSRWRVGRYQGSFLRFGILKICEIPTISLDHHPGALHNLTCTRS